MQDFARGGSLIVLTTFLASGMTKPDTGRCPTEEMLNLQQTLQNASDGFLRECLFQ